MVKRIAFGVVVSLLLMLWPAASVAAEAEQSRMITLTEEYSVCPDKVEDFKKYMKEATEAAAVHGFPYRWDVYALDDMRFLAIIWVDELADIEEMAAAWTQVLEKWHEQTGTDWRKEFSATMSHWDSSVWITRPDLSYFPADEKNELNYVVWGLLSIKLGHQDEVEALLRDYLKAFAERGYSYGWRAAQLAIGPGIPTLVFVDWASSPGVYWMRHDEEEKDEVLGAKSAEIWGKMLPHIRDFDYVTGHYLKELSYHPAKPEAVDE